MKDELAEQDFEGVSALIKKEEEEALALFRAGDFRHRLETRLRESARDERRADLARRMALPAAAAALALIAVGIFFFALKRPGAGPPPEFRALASALAQLPGFSPSLELEGTISAEKTGTSRLAESVGQALARAAQTKEKVEENISVPAEKSRVPRLSLEQKMEILFQERAIERALLLIRNESKEV